MMPMETKSIKDLVTKIEEQLRAEQETTEEEERQRQRLMESIYNARVQEIIDEVRRQLPSELQPYLMIVGYKKFDPTGEIILGKSDFIPDLWLVEAPHLATIRFRVMRESLKLWNFAVLSPIGHDPGAIFTEYHDIRPIILKAFEYRKQNPDFYRDR